MSEEKYVFFVGCQGTAGANRLKQEEDFVSEGAEDKKESDKQTASRHKNMF